VEEIEDRGAVEGEREGDAGDSGETGHVPCELEELAGSATTAGCEMNSRIQDGAGRQGREERVNWGECVTRPTHLRLVDREMRRSRSLQSLFVEDVDLLCRLDVLGRHEPAADQHGAARTPQNRLLPLERGTPDSPALGQHEARARCTEHGRYDELAGSCRDESHIAGPASLHGRIVHRMNHSGPTETRRGEDRSSGEHGREHDACEGYRRGREDERTRKEDE
jgi:hypothetical protein